MRKITCLSLFLLMIFSVQAQDVLTKTSGETVNCEILLESEDALLVKIKLRYGKPAEMQIIKAEIEGFRYEEGIEGSMDSITEGSDVYTNSLEAVKKSSEMTTVGLLDLSVAHNALMKNRSFEVLFSPEYLSMSNLMFKSGKHNQFRIGILYHSALARTGLQNEVAQISLGGQFNRIINNNVSAYVSTDVVLFGRKYSSYSRIINYNTTNPWGEPSYFSGINSRTDNYLGLVLGGGFDVTITDAFYVGIETGIMVIKNINGRDDNFLSMSNNTGIRFGIRF